MSQKSLDRNVDSVLMAQLNNSRSKQAHQFSKERRFSSIAVQKDGDLINVVGTHRDPSRRNDTHNKTQSKFPSTTRGALGTKNALNVRSGSIDLEGRGGADVDTNFNPDQ